jgi:hypothetical protein
MPPGHNVYKIFIDIYFNFFVDMVPLNTSFSVPIYFSFFYFPSFPPLFFMLSLSKVFLLPLHTYNTSVSSILFPSTFITVPSIYLLGRMIFKSLPINYQFPITAECKLGADEMLRRLWRPLPSPTLYKNSRWQVDSSRSTMILPSLILLLTASQVAVGFPSLPSFIQFTSSWNFKV